MTAELREQTKESTRLDKLTWVNMEEVGYG
ncbi:MAG: hypothetical protein DDT36_00211 [Firmicutes bacterium]|nr:hypothetical protein [Bacillota bacterium]